MKTLLICIFSVGLLCYIANTSHLPPQTNVEAATAVLAPKDTLLLRLSKAVAKIESRGNAKARRFEPHVFTRLTGSVAKSFDEARKIDWRSAAKSTSIGKYQILGTNYRRAGFTRIEDMYRANEERQDSAFVHFVTVSGLYSHIQRGDYAKFARGYNGKGYKKNRYDKKLIAEMR